MRKNLAFYTISTFVIYFVTLTIIPLFINLKSINIFTAVLNIVFCLFVVWIFNLVYSKSKELIYKDEYKTEIATLVIIILCPFLYYGLDSEFYQKAFTVFNYIIYIAYYNFIRRVYNIIKFATAEESYTLMKYFSFIFPLLCYGAMLFTYYITNYTKLNVLLFDIIPIIKNSILLFIFSWIEVFYFASIKKFIDKHMLYILAYLMFCIIYIAASIFLVNSLVSILISAIIFILISYIFKLKAYNNIIKLIE